MHEQKETKKTKITRQANTQALADDRANDQADAAPPPSPSS
jgi:hypothetical protein